MSALGGEDEWDDQNIELKEIKSAIDV